MSESSVSAPGTADSPTSPATSAAAPTDSALPSLRVTVKENRTNRTFEISCLPVCTRLDARFALRLLPLWAVQL